MKMSNFVFRSRFTVSLNNLACDLNSCLLSQIMADALNVVFPGVDGRAVRAAILTALGTATATASASASTALPVATDPLLLKQL